VTLAVRRIGPRVHAAFRRSQETFAELTSSAQENFGGTRVVKSLALEDAEIEGFRALSLRHLERSMEGERLSNWMGPLVRSIGDLAVVLLLLVSGRMMLSGRFNLGQFVEFNGYMAILIWPMVSIGWVVNQAHRGTASVARLREILAARSEVADGVREPAVAGAPLILLPAAGGLEVAVRSLTFGYGGRPVLRDVSLEVPRGTTAAIIGRTGSGKSTLLSLLARLYRVPDGTIFIDGRDVNAIPLAELRRRIGFVPQESFLFSRTILENITFALDGEEGLAAAAADGAVAERARRCAATSRLDKDVDQFPRGFDEVVGERGVTLSGGQKQRVAIARALLADPPLLLLDDPLSAVDAHTEEEIVRNLREASRGRTTIIASHRVLGVREANRIYVLDEGRVVEWGGHQELLSRGGIYARLHRRQILADELESL
jgi:ATP-binding cassette, subfamily B, multidrug efflux pump